MFLKLRGPDTVPIPFPHCVGDSTRAHGQRSPALMPVAVRRLFGAVAPGGVMCPRLCGRFRAQCLNRASDVITPTNQEFSRHEREVIPHTHAQTSSMLSPPRPSTAALLSAAATTRPVLGGYDMVAYWQNPRAATTGVPSFNHTLITQDCNDGTGHCRDRFTSEFWFASAAHRDEFAADPWAYVPRYGGF